MDPMQSLARAYFVATKKFFQTPFQMNSLIPQVLSAPFLPFPLMAEGQPSNDVHLNFLSTMFTNIIRRQTAAGENPECCSADLPA